MAFKLTSHVSADIFLHVPEPLTGRRTAAAKVGSGSGSDSDSGSGSDSDADADPDADPDPDAGGSGSGGGRGGGSGDGSGSGSGDGSGSGSGDGDGHATRPRPPRRDNWSTSKNGNRNSGTPSGSGESSGAGSDSTRRQQQRRRQQQLTIVFFITGNPGLISYYHPFLSLVAADLERSPRYDQTENEDKNENENEKESRDHVVVVAGFSLGGFEVECWTGNKTKTSRGTEGEGEGESVRKDEHAHVRMDELLYPPVRFPCLSEGLGQRQHSHSGSGSSRSQSQPQEQSQDQDQDQDQDESDKSQPKEPKEQTAQPSPCEDDDNDDDKTNTRLYSLREQIELSYARLEKLVDTLRNHNHNCKDGLSTAKAASTGPGDGTAALETGEQEQEREREQDQEQDQEQQREQEPGRDPTQGQVPEPQPLVNVVLVGHSVGAYIALEIVRLRHERHGFRQSSSSTTSSSSASNRANSTSGINISSTSTDTTRTGQSSTSSPPAASVNASWTVTACILLTPTIVDIHRSPSGRVATPLLTSLQLALPSASASRFILPVLAHTLVHSVLVKSLPSTWLSWLVERVAGMKRGSHGSDATLAFLRSPRGVKQALYMAADEMGQIRADGWGEEVWGAAAVDNDIGGATRFSPTPRLYFWFAKSDHWVADITREEIQRARGGGVVERDEIDILGHATDEVQFRLDATNHDKHAVDEAPMVRIYETDGLAHAWCLNQSEFVARRVIGWLREILGQECRESV